MFSNKDDSGVFSFLVGMIVLVMAGVGISVMVDSRFRFSGTRSAIERDIRQQALEVSDLAMRLESREELFARTGPRRDSDAKSYEALVARAAASAANVTELEERKDALEIEIETAEKAFADYRTRYRKSEWASAAGETLPVLKTRSGRDYREVTISRITEVGMEIRHSDGIARINAPDLEDSWHDRFQWSDEERRLKLDAERKLASSFVNVPPKKAGEASPSRRPAQPQDADLVSARRKEVALWKSKVSSLRVELQDARRQASSRGQASVPGSLETWQARAQRLSGELTRATARLNLAKQALAEVAPGDPLLRAEEEIED